MSMGSDKPGYPTLIGTNYASWSLHCKAALMKAGLWRIVNGKEDPPPESAKASEKAAFEKRQESATGIIMLGVHEDNLYLIGDAEDPQEVWKILQDQFQPSTWAATFSIKEELE